jgi:hypothetical protein
MGFIAPTGSFTPGSTENRGGGFWSIFYSTGFAYYPSGDRKGWGISAIARIEQNFEQRGTGITPGDALTIDYGIDHPIAFVNHKYIFDVGLTGFAQTQITRESGANAAVNTTPYRLFGMGPEVDWLMPAYDSKLVIRPQWEFGARNTSQGWTFWLGFIHSFGPLFWGNRSCHHTPHVLKCRRDRLSFSHCSSPWLSCRFVLRTGLIQPHSYKTPPCSQWRVE